MTEPEHPGSLFTDQTFDEMDLLGSAGVDEELRTDAPHMIEGSAEHRKESRRDVQHEERSEDRSRVATGLVRQRDDRVHDEDRHLGADEHIELSNELTELQLAEAEEVRRVLTRVCDVVRAAASAAHRSRLPGVVLTTRR